MTSKRVGLARRSRRHPLADNRPHLVGPSTTLVRGALQDRRAPARKFLTRSFDSIEHARAFARLFFDWYNGEHRHPDRAAHTATVHHGQAEQTYDRPRPSARRRLRRHPERFINKPPVLLQRSCRSTVKLDSQEASNTNCRPTVSLCLDRLRAKVFELWHELISNAKASREPRDGSHHAVRNETSENGSTVSSSTTR